MGTALGLPLGPLLGGWLLDHFWWGSIFLVNLPVAAIAILILAIALPESRGSVQRRPDVAGGLLSTAGLVGVVYGLIEAPDRGWTDPLVASTVIAGIALLAAFAWWERRTANPMIDLRLFRNPLFLWGSTAGVLVSFGLLGMLFVVPQYLQLVAGYDAFGTGLRLLPLIGGLVIGAPLGERLTTRAGFQLPIAGGLLTLAVGLAAGTVTSTTSPYGMVAAWLTVVGFGTGMALSPAMNAVLAALPAEQSGAGTAITMTLRQVGGALGVALLGSILARSYANRLDVDAVPTAASSAAHDSLAGAIAVAERLNEPALAAAAQAAYIHGMRWVLVTSAILAAASALLIASRLDSRSGREAEADTPTAKQVSE